MATVLPHSSATVSNAVLTFFQSLVSRFDAQALDKSCGCRPHFVGEDADEGFLSSLYIKNVVPSPRQRQ